MLSFFAWYFVITLLGWLVFPLAYRLFPGLSDRGYSLSKIFGLLIWGYLFWILASLGLIHNDIFGILLALLSVASGSAWVFWKSRDNASAPLEAGMPADRDSAARPSAESGEFSIVRWVKSRVRLVVTVEVLFFLAFAFLAFVRACVPEIIGTEKPMELAFINGIIRSPTFPPRDPWLSGYAISYYYFGYVMTAMLAEVTGVLGSVAFNLMLALVFALSAVGAYGVLYNLIAAWHNWQTQTTNRRSSHKGTAKAQTEASQSQGINQKSLTRLPLIGPLFLLIVSNFEGFLEILSGHGLFWKFNAQGTATSAFWSWLGIQDINQAPPKPFVWIPQRNWWWWRASRVIQDLNLAGKATPFSEIIDEFPLFSYLLGDLHPHVLAMPFDLLMVGAALNLFMGGWKGETRLFGLRLPIEPVGFLFLGVMLGGLAFLNTWDILFGFALVTGVSLFERVRQDGWKWNRLKELLVFILPLGLLAILLYLPFYVGFASQASGILPNLDLPTRGTELWIYWGPLLLPVMAYLLYLWRREHRPFNWKWGFGLAAGLMLLLWLFSWILGLLIQVVDPKTVSDYLSVDGVASLGALFRAALQRRFVFTGSWLTLLVWIGATIALLGPLVEARLSRQEPADGFGETQAQGGRRSPTAFILLLILAAGLLVLAPEFFFLRDVFSDRMNTVFKFYYQAWLMLSSGLRLRCGGVAAIPARQVGIGLPHRSGGCPDHGAGLSLHGVYFAHGWFQMDSVPAGAQPGAGCREQASLPECSQCLESGWGRPVLCWVPRRCRRSSLAPDRAGRVAG